MSEELSVGLDSGLSSREGLNFTEAEIQAIQEDERKAKKVAQQIQSRRKQDSNIAKFLTYVINDIKDDNLIIKLYNVFFMTLNKKTNIKHIKKKINHILIVGMFAPFYPKQISEYNLLHYFKKIYDFNSKFTLDKYILYLKKLSYHYHDKVPISRENLLEFVLSLFKYYGIISNTHTPEEYQQTYNHIRQKLFGK